MGAKEIKEMLGAWLCGQSRSAEPAASSAASPTVPGPVVPAPLLPGSTWVGNKLLPGQSQGFANGIQPTLASFSPGACLH